MTRYRATPRAGGKHPEVIPPSNMIDRASQMLGCIDMYRRSRPHPPKCNRRLGRPRERSVGSEDWRAAMRAGDRQTGPVLLPDRPV